MNRITRTAPPCYQISALWFYLKSAMCFLKERARSEWPADNPWVQTPLCARKTGRNIVGLPSHWRNLRVSSSIFLALTACPCWFSALSDNRSDYRRAAVSLILVTNVLTSIPCLFSGFSPTDKDWNCPLLCCQTRTRPTLTPHSLESPSSAQRLKLSGHGRSRCQNLPAPVHRCHSLR